MKENSSKSRNLISQAKSNGFHSFIRCGLIGAVLGAMIGATIGAFIGYSLNFDPDFSISLDHMKVPMGRNDIVHNTLIINDRCPGWLRLIKHYDNQIYPRVDKMPNGSTINFIPRAVTTLKKNSTELIDLKISTLGSIEPGSHLVYVDVFGADTKKKTCMMEISVRS